MNTTYTRPIHDLYVKETSEPTVSNDEFIGGFVWLLATFPDKDTWVSGFKSKIMITLYGIWQKCMEHEAMKLRIPWLEAC